MPNLVYIDSNRFAMGAGVSENVNISSINGNIITISSRVSAFILNKNVLLSQTYVSGSTTYTVTANISSAVTDLQFVIGSITSTPAGGTFQLATAILSIPYKLDSNFGYVTNKPSDTEGFIYAGGLLTPSIGMTSFGPLGFSTAGPNNDNNFCEFNISYGPSTSYYLDTITGGYTNGNKAANYGTRLSVTNT